MSNRDPFEAQRRRGLARFAHMHRPAEVIEAEARERHKRWLALLTEGDWLRIRALAKQVRPGYSPARLDDLDATTLAAGVCAVGDEHLFSGERVGTVRDGTVAVLIWEK